MDYGRINNTIMHEIGHIVLDHSEKSSACKGEIRIDSVHCPALVIFTPMSLECTWRLGPGGKPYRISLGGLRKVWEA